MVYSFHLGCPELGTHKKEFTPFLFFPPRSGFVQQRAEQGLANLLRSFANLLD
jgi:hypothetical protein